MYAMLIEKGGIRPFSSFYDCSSCILQTVGIQASLYYLGMTSLAFMIKGCVAFALYPNFGRLPSFKGSMDQEEILLPAVHRVSLGIASRNITEKNE